MLSNPDKARLSPQYINFPAEFSLILSDEELRAQERAKDPDKEWAEEQRRQAEEYSSSCQVNLLSLMFIFRGDADNSRPHDRSSGAIR